VGQQTRVALHTTLLSMAHEAGLANEPRVSTWETSRSISSRVWNMLLIRCSRQQSLWRRQRPRGESSCASTRYTRWPRSMPHVENATARCALPTPDGANTSTLAASCTNAGASSSFTWRLTGRLSQNRSHLACAGAADAPKAHPRTHEELTTDGLDVHPVDLETRHGGVGCGRRPPRRLSRTAAARSSPSCSRWARARPSAIVAELPRGRRTAPVPGAPPRPRAVASVLFAAEYHFGQDPPIDLAGSAAGLAWLHLDGSRGADHVRGAGPARSGRPTASARRTGAFQATKPSRPTVRW